jgi:hypothetical protein
MNSKKSLFGMFTFILILWNFISHGAEAKNECWFIKDPLSPDNYPLYSVKDQKTQEVSPLFQLQKDPDFNKSLFQAWVQNHDCDFTNQKEDTVCSFELNENGETEFYMKKRGLDIVSLGSTKDYYQIKKYLRNIQILNICHFQTADSCKISLSGREKNGRVWDSPILISGNIFIHGENKTIPLLENQLVDFKNELISMNICKESEISLSQCSVTPLHTLSDSTPTLNSERVHLKINYSQFEIRNANSARELVQSLTDKGLCKNSPKTISEKTINDAARNKLDGSNQYSTTVPYSTSSR